MLSQDFERAVRLARIPRVLSAAGIERSYIDVSGVPGACRLPRSLVILLENCIRRARCDEEAIVHARRIVDAGLSGTQGEEIEFMPARVLFQDFTGVPVFVDFAAMRDAMVERGGDPRTVNPRIPCTLVVDHSVIADETGHSRCAQANEAHEAGRNRERFAFLKWASQSFDNVEIVPPGGGICHQLNMERFCKVVATDALAEDGLACFDTLVGTDSHTPTANGLGVLGWGVGGIEAEAAALGQAISMLVPPVVELRLEGSLSDGISGMDLALSVAQRLRAEDVVGCVVEVTGDAVSTLSATQRACVSNMTPEYGATATLFPVDERSRAYLELTGRDPAEVDFAFSYLEAQGVLGAREGRVYSRTIKLDLSQVELSLAGPSRPHRRTTPAALRERFRSALAGHGRSFRDEPVLVDLADEHLELRHGCIAIAAITSCTTATDPAMMVAAGLLARKARERGLLPKPWVKKVLAPGSHATELLLRRSGLDEDLFSLGFYTTGFGCMSCIGNSGEIHPALREHAGDVELASVLSGNRNFDGRISPDVAQNYLCSPALVVAYSLCGSVDVDLSRECVGVGADGLPVMLEDLIPSDREVEDILEEFLDESVFVDSSAGLFEGSASWRELPQERSDCFSWDEGSTYVRRPPYFEGDRPQAPLNISGARTLALLGDFVTTDHISPAGSFSGDSPAGLYLLGNGVQEAQFNSYGSRRGNHEVMMRGTFANVRLENLLARGRLGGWTTDQLDGSLRSIFDASRDYKDAGIPLVVLAGKMYGSGSSRDWAAKGPLLLGVRAVIAESFERIHRSNLVQMGILPLQFDQGQGAAFLGLTGDEVLSVSDIDLSGGLPNPPRCVVSAERSSGELVEFECTVRVDTPMEGKFLSAGGILPYVLGQLA
ncbi:aconitate hydratase AcnA [Olsenella urininfantis]|uniref:aconitate hydratase AcnA n=1 Tax=Olsenella urininfantis TaxID=1871033 RepID=UPI000984E558|nr:aconitate hydratase AcnA [Olsenella urininfantis]